MVLFAGAGALAYAAFGSSIQTVVFVNLPQDDKFVNTSQFLYSVAILLSTPLQLFPAVRIMENGLFSRSGKYNHKVKWEKNLFRAGCVFACAAIAWAGAADLDKFVSLIGSVACVPLCFCYPAMLHYKACAHSRKQKVLDIALFVFGLLAAIYTTTQTASPRSQFGRIALLPGTELLFPVPADQDARNGRGGCPADVRVVPAEGLSGESRRECRKRYAPVGGDEKYRVPALAGSRC